MRPGNTLGIWGVRESSSPRGKKGWPESDLLKYAFNLPETGLVAKER